MKLRKIAGAAMCLLMVGGFLTGCQSQTAETQAEAQTEAQTEVQTETPEEKAEYAFTYHDYQYEIGMAAEDAMEQLGEAVSSRDVNNCANGYVNKAYLYGDKDFEVYIEQIDGKEVVTNITLLTASVATEEGLKVGDGEDQVTAVYPDAEKGLGSYQTAKGNSKLYIKMGDGKVDYIAYMAEK